MNKRERVLALLGPALPDVVPAGFFLHFDPAHHAGRPAVDKHLEFFRATGMDLVKVQYEQALPSCPMPGSSAPRPTLSWAEPSPLALSSSRCCSPARPSA